MDKRQLHHLWRQFRAVKPVYFLGAAVVSGGVCLFALRANNEHMISLRNAVYQADKDNGDVEGALQNLRSYVISHMNTDLSSDNAAVYPPIQLKYTYDRLVRAESEKLVSSNKQLQAQARAYCGTGDIPEAPNRSQECVDQYVHSHSFGKTTKQIPDALYKFDFISPNWSPDLAGWSMLIAIASFALFLITFAVNRWLKAATR